MRTTRRAKAITGIERDIIMMELRRLMKAYNIAPYTIHKMAEIAARERP
jgi:hypothetical protein